MRKYVPGGILIALLACSVQARPYGDWTSDFRTPGMQFATTTGDGGAITGVACTTNSQICTAFVSTGVACEVGARVPLILNSAIGAFPVTAECVRTGSQEVLVANEFDQMLRAYESGGEIGFAMPLESGRFRIFRFSTIGAVAAVKEARTFPAGPR